MSKDDTIRVTQSEQIQVYASLARVKAPWLAPLLEAAADGELRLFFIQPGQGSMPPKWWIDESAKSQKNARPTVVIACDDHPPGGREVGPSEFPFGPKTMRRFGCALVATAKPEPLHYCAVAARADLDGRPGLIVETGPRKDADWVNMLMSYDVPTLHICEPPKGEA